MIRVSLAITLYAAIFGGQFALAASPDSAAAAKKLETPDQVLLSVEHQSIGAPSRADIGDQATIRLAEDLVFVPQDPATKLLTILRTIIPPGFKGLVLGDDGMDTAAVIRFVPSGFVDSDAILAWTADDMLSSLNDTVERANPDRVKANKQPLEARRWVLPPHYDAQMHQLIWAALIVPKTAPRESDGEVFYHAAGFGREGYIDVTVVSSMQKANTINHMFNNILGSMAFHPGKAYADTLPADKRAQDGLTGVMGIDRFHKAPVPSKIWRSETVIPAAGGLVATIGALALLIYIRRHMRREARRG